MNAIKIILPKDDKDTHYSFIYRRGSVRYLYADKDVESLHILQKTEHPTTHRRLGKSKNDLNREQKIL